MRAALKLCVICIATILCVGGCQTQEGLITGCEEVGWRPIRFSQQEFDRTKKFPTIVFTCALDPSNDQQTMNLIDSSSIQALFIGNRPLQFPLPNNSEALVLRKKHPATNEEFRFVVAKIREAPEQALIMTSITPVKNEGGGKQKNPLEHLHGRILLYKLKLPSQ